GIAQGGYGLFVGNIPSDEDNAGRQFRTVPNDPGVDVSAIHAPRSAHIGNHAKEFSALEQAQAFGSGLSADDGVAVALQGGTNISHDGGLVLNQQHWQGDGFGSRECHHCTTPAAAPTEAVSNVAGRRTMNVAPSAS